MTSRAVSNGMPSRISFEYSDHRIDNPGNSRSGSKQDRLVGWLYATYLLVHITYWLVVGSFLVLFPWLRIWEHNYLLYQFPGLRPVVVSPFLKGAVLGLGIVNLIIGFLEIAHLRKGPGISLPR